MTSKRIVYVTPACKVLRAKACWNKVRPEGTSREVGVRNSPEALPPGNCGEDHCKEARATAEITPVRITLSCGLYFCRTTARDTPGIWELEYTSIVVDTLAVSPAPFVAINVINSVLICALLS